MKRRNRICLIGAQHGYGSTLDVVSMDRLKAMEAWARRSGFDAVAICSEEGLCDSAESVQRPVRLLGKMSRKQREAWAAKVVDDIKRRWSKAGVINLREVVLLCSIDGYQELAKKLDELDGVIVTMPLECMGLLRNSIESAQQRPQSKTGLCESTA